MTKVPTFDQLMNPTLAALRELGGSGSIEEIYERVIKRLQLPEDVLSIMHDSEDSNQTEVHYRLAWARSYLKKFGAITNSSRGVWALTKPDLTNVDSKHVLKTVRDNNKKDKEAKSEPSKPTAGKGIARIHGFMSFHVVFQCKRYKGVVTASDIRDFRGAMVGRSDKGLFITTGTFSRDAIKEATRDGAPPIDLVAGDQLADKLKEFSLGIQTSMVESVTLDEEWFKKI